jgi:hypothetical protein
MELTTAEASYAIGMSPQALRAHIEAGRLPARKHGFRGTLKINVDDLRAFTRKYNYIMNEEYVLGLAQKQIVN